jgi:hypothetical protein
VRTQVVLSSAVVARALVSAALAILVSLAAFSSGWFVRYSIQDGIPGAMARFAERLDLAIEELRQYSFFDRIFHALLKGNQEHLGFPLFAGPERPDRPRRRLASAGPTAVTTDGSVGPAGPTTGPAAGASPSPRAGPRRVAPAETPRSQVLSFLAGARELAARDRQELAAQVKRWKRGEPHELVALVESMDRLASVREDLRRSLGAQILRLQAVAAAFRLDAAADDADRIAWGWDAADLRPALERDGPAGIRRLAQGRPPAFFVELAQSQEMLQECRENLAALRDGKARRSRAPSARQGGSRGLRPKAAPRAARSGQARPESALCPARGKYDAPGGPEWRCTVHGTLKSPFELAARITRYLEPVDDALRNHRAGQTGEALQSLGRVLRLYPRHILAVNGIAEICHDRKEWSGLIETLAPWMAPGKGPDNARWAFLMALAHHATGNVEGARQFAARARAASPSAPPPNTTSLLDFYLVKDRSADVTDAARNGILFGDYELRKDEDCPSFKCLANLRDVRGAIVRFVHGYPGTHPDLAGLRQKQARAAQLLARLPRGPKLDQVKARSIEIDARVALITGDAAGRMLWKSLVTMLSGYRTAACPAGGRCTLERGDRLECSRHPGILGEPLSWQGRKLPTAHEETALTRALLSGALASDPRRRRCFEVQKTYVTARAAAGIRAGEITTATTLPSGEALACPTGGALKAVDRPNGPPTIECEHHGSWEDYFAGAGAGVGVGAGAATATGEPEPVPDPGAKE